MDISKQLNGLKLKFRLDCHKLVNNAIMNIRGDLSQMDVETAPQGKKFDNDSIKVVMICNIPKTKVPEVNNYIAGLNPQKVAKKLASN